MSRDWAAPAPQVTERAEAAPYRPAAARPCPNGSPVRGSSCRPARSRCGRTTPTTRTGPGTDFYWLTGSIEPDAVLVFEPPPRRRVTLYLAPIGWTGRPRPSSPIAATASCGSAPPRRGGDRPPLGIDAPARRTRAAAKGSKTPVARLRDHDARGRRAARPRIGRGRRGESTDPDAELATVLSELRLVKDDHEIELLDAAVDATARGFEEAVRELAAASARRTASVDRGNLLAPGPRRGQRRRLRHRSWRGAARLHAALDRATTARRPAATSLLLDMGSRRTSCTPPTSPAPCRSTGASRPSSARSTRLVLARPAGRHRTRSQPGNDFLDPAPGGDGGARRGARSSWGILTVHRRRSARGDATVLPPLHAAHVEPHARARRPRLRRGARRDLQVRHARAGHGASPSSPACTSRPTTSPFPSGTAASACASRTTCSSPPRGTGTCRRAAPPGRRGRGVGPPADQLTPKETIRARRERDRLRAVGSNTVCQPVVSWDARFRIGAVDPAVPAGSQPSTRGTPRD